MRFLTAGESHGPGLVGILEGLPAGLRFDEEFINHQLWRRQQGFGRSGRQKIERDRIEVSGGLSEGLTTAGPVALRIENRDWPNWQSKEVPPLTIPRPGHADLTGRLKYGFPDMRHALERASARETAMRVALGSVARLLLRELGVEIGSYVTAIGEVEAHPPQELAYPERFAQAERSEMRCPLPEREEAFKERIRQAARARDTVGGVFEVVALEVPPGWGSYVHWEHRLNARLAYAVMSIQAIKAVEIGAGVRSGALPGTQMHDELFLEDGQVVRRSNNAGGIEGGISNGAAIIVRATMKPISTTLTPRRSVDLQAGVESETRYERSDICAVPAAAVVGEAMVAWALAQAAREKYGGDSLEEMLAHFRASQELTSKRWVNR